MGRSEMASLRGFVEMAGIVQVRGLVKRFGELTAVDHIEFSIAEGETFGLLGPNGAGARLLKFE